MSIIHDSLAEIGLEVVKNKIIGIKDEAAIKSRLKDYLERQKALNFNCTRDEEIDFQMLADYIRRDLIEDVKLRLFGGSKEERNSARKAIIRKAVAYSNANTKLAEKRAEKMIETSVNILRKYYESRVNRDLLFISAKIEDAVTEVITQQNQELSKQIAHTQQKIGAANLLSIDNNLELARSGKIAKVEENFATAIRAISTEHELFPLYEYKMGPQGKFISSPLSEEAVRKYPPNVRLMASSVRLGDTKVGEISPEVLSESYRHQLSIYVDVYDAKHYLGEKLDPVQHEVEGLAGSVVELRPPEFPEAFPCNISVDGEVKVDYILLRTKEIMDDGSYLVTNEEQDNRPYNVRILSHLSNRRIDLSFTANNPTSSELLSFLQLEKAVNAGGELTIKDLSQNSILFGGSANPKDDPLLDYTIEILKKIVVIEKHFGMAFCLPAVISATDLEAIDYVYDLIENGSYMGTWTNIELEFIMSEELKQHILEIANKEYMLQYSFTEEICLLEQEVQLHIMRALRCARFADMDKLKQKAQVLDPGDPIKITYVAADLDNSGLYMDINRTGMTEKEALGCLMEKLGQSFTEPISMPKGRVLDMI